MIFDLIQKNFATIGIEPCLATQLYPLNGRIFIGFLILVSGTICDLIYFFKEAKTFAEHTQSMYTCTMGAEIALYLLILILQVDKLFELINGCDSLAHTSKYEAGNVSINFKI